MPVGVGVGELVAEEVIGVGVHRQPGTAVELPGGGPQAAVGWGMLGRALTAGVVVVAGQRGPQHLLGAVVGGVRLGQPRLVVQPGGVVVQVAGGGLALQAGAGRGVGFAGHVAVGVVGEHRAAVGAGAGGAVTGVGVRGQVHVGRTVADRLEAGGGALQRRPGRVGDLVQRHLVEAAGRVDRAGDVLDRDGPTAAAGHRVGGGVVRGPGVGPAQERAERDRELAAAVTESAGVRHRLRGGHGQRVVGWRLRGQQECPAGLQAGRVGERRAAGLGPVLVERPDLRPPAGVAELGLGDTAEGVAALH